MIKVFIISDHPVMVAGLESLLQRDFLVSGSATTGAGCLKHFRYGLPDVLLLDCTLPDMDSIHLCRQVSDRFPAVMVLALGDSGQRMYKERMMANGASGYILKNALRHEFIGAVQQVAMGQIYPSVEENSLVTTSALQPAGRALTKREREIMQLITEGFTNTQIAEQLFISIDTVDTHRKNLYSKLQVRNTAMLMRYAAANCLLTNE